MSPESRRGFGWFIVLSDLTTKKFNLFSRLIHDSSSSFNDTLKNYLYNDK
ncbi:hypothetical protein RVIR1_01210 [Candidatus Rickettsiella viridis]|uniref:Uncharacterized protein n=1 Tax=Candidatus Rickettsiella viridis TaxID=676208 RepID=A0A2Z5UUI7_9COXI|nr:hypothetical protein RVIR1_01210 [Candidatus Rickettsiella viridis]